MRQSIEKLLSVEQRVGDFMEQSVPCDLIPMGLTTDIECGSTIGAYRLIEKLGAGGMGVVFRAEQIGPLQREVAIKLIRSSVNTQGMLARFDTERKALALIGEYDHLPAQYKSELENKPSGLFGQLQLLRQVGFRNVDCFWKYGIFCLFGGTK